MSARISKARLVLQNPNGISVRREKTSSNYLPLTPNQERTNQMQTTKSKKTETLLSTHNKKPTKKAIKDKLAAKGISRDWMKKHLVII